MVSEQVVASVALNPRNTYVMPDADAVGRHGRPGYGPYMVVYLRLEGDVITEASCQTYGCPAAIACGSKLTEWAKGKTTAEAARLSDDEVRRWFEKFPLGKWHCARIAAAALRNAVTGAPACSETPPAASGVSAGPANGVTGREAKP